MKTPPFSLGLPVAGLLFFCEVRHGYTSHGFALDKKREHELIKNLIKYEMRSQGKCDEQAVHACVSRRQWIKRSAASGLWGGRSNQKGNFREDSLRFYGGPLEVSGVRENKVLPHENGGKPTGHSRMNLAAVRP